MAIDFKSAEKEARNVWEKYKEEIKVAVQDDSSKPLFSFLEGPPTANAPPGLHHLEVRTFKDVICKYKFMQGFSVPRKGGWDCHGLPVEVQVEKALGLNSKKEILDYGQNKFIDDCKTSVFSNIKEWNESTEELNYWIDLENPYQTLDNNYVESVWWSLKELYNKNLLYEGDKVVPFCPRCSTPLSSHEVSQGYKEVKEKSIIVKFKLKNDERKLLVWTTTPWTLPSNLAIAINPNLNYIVVEFKGEKLILVEELVSKYFEEPKILEKISGKDLIGKMYEPLMPYFQNLEGAFKIIGGNFVETGEGTGIVHMAPAFGEIDYDICKENKIPFVKPVDQSGNFTSEVPDFEGKFIKDCDKEIGLKLHKEGKMFKVLNYKHDYPFCWRCDSPLMYYAINSWFVKSTAVKEKMVELNKKINWNPKHIQEGRFGMWLENIKDWNLSRFKFWGTPLPVWKCSEGCGKEKIIGSVEELKKESNNFPSKKIYLMRHGEAESNIREIISAVFEKDEFNLTEKGKIEVKESSKKLKGKIDLIITSDFKRTKQTAEIVSKITGAKIIVDSRLRDSNHFNFEGKSPKDFFKVSPKKSLRISEVPEGIESIQSISARIGESINENMKKYPNKRILFVSHSEPIKAHLWKNSGKEKDKIDSLESIKNAEIVESQIKNEYDLHRPWIDDIKLKCECGNEMKRIKDVIDCWYDSGSATFAQFHYPFENKKEFEKRFPYDFISEAIDQTRGWFYTLHALSTMLFENVAYKNVICAGHILDGKGEKMSKSKGNIIKPREIFNSVGIDAVRLQMCINDPGNSKRFSEEMMKKSVLPFLNVLYNFKTYFNQLKEKKLKKRIEDKWILSRLESATNEMEGDLDKFNLDKALQKLIDFCVNDFSRTYIRITRDREDTKEIVGKILEKISLLLAPYAPYISESIFQKFHEEKSVHLTKWPKYNKEKINKNLEKEFSNALQIIEAGLRERDINQIGLKWPLAKATIYTPELIEEIGILKIVKQQLNVKELKFERGKGIHLDLDLELTPELKAEGYARELSRKIQAFRKKLGLNKDDKIELYIFSEDNLKQILENQNEFLVERTNSNLLEFVLEEKNLRGEKEDFKIKKFFGKIGIVKL